MPRNAEDTRELLLHAGRRLFACDGVYQVPLNAIVRAAGQRNASALHYHFGGRQGLLDAIIAVHDEQIEEDRRAFLDDLRGQSRGERLVDLVAALVIPFSRTLLDADGREFLQILVQLAPLFDAWDSPDSPEQARLVFTRIAELLEVLRPELDADVRHLRVTTFLDLVTHALAARARRLESGGDPPIDHEGFVANLIAMSVGALAGVAPDQPGNIAEGSSGSNSSVGRTRA